MITITIGQRKGGNGKSTGALNLAHAFALSGKRILLIDLDDQKNSTSAIKTLAPSTKTIEDLLLDESVTVADAAAVDCDLCLIDTSPALNILVVNALCASHWLFVPLYVPAKLDRTSRLKNLKSSGNQS